MKYSFSDKYFLTYDLQLFAQDGPNGEKTEEPTPKKLEDARKKGQVARSTDVTTALSLLVFFAMLKVMVGYIGDRFMGGFNDVYRHISDYAKEDFTNPFSMAIIGDGVKKILITGLPFYLVILAVTVISILAQVR